MQPSGPIVISSYKPQKLRLFSLVYDMEAIIPTDLQKLAIKLARISGISVLERGGGGGVGYQWRYSFLKTSNDSTYLIGILKSHTTCHWIDQMGTLTR